MYWYGQFKSGFADAWTQSGLPPAERYEAAYTAALKAVRFTYAPSDYASSRRNPLDPEIINAVYGFGVLFGKICGSLLGLSRQITEERSEWCGRFNLGISLFDYLCDEASRATTVVALPAFRPFLKPLPSETTVLCSLAPAEELLNELATGVLTDLEQIIGSTNPTRRRAGLWHALQEMFKAELGGTTSVFQPNADLTRVRRTLRLKSREPFRVMAEWMAYGSRPARRQTVLIQSSRLGRALGHCYWLTDDAKDVWADLDAGRWNLFLIQAATVEPSLFQRARDSIIDLRLIQIWECADSIKLLSRSAIRQLVKSLVPLSIPVRQREETLGIVAASLAHW